MGGLTILSTIQPVSLGGSKWGGILENPSADPYVHFDKLRRKVLMQPIRSLAAGGLRAVRAALTWKSKVPASPCARSVALLTVRSSRPAAAARRMKSSSTMPRKAGRSVQFTLRLLDPQLGRVFFNPSVTVRLGWVHGLAIVADLPLDKLVTCRRTAPGKVPRISPGAGLEPLRFIHNCPSRWRPVPPKTETTAWRSKTDS
jgi:hypothetical protein